MSRPIRFIPPGSLVEVTCRTIQSRLLLRPSEEVREILVGVLGRAQRLFDLELHAAVALSNHYHLLASPRDAQQLAGFMGYVNSNLAREVGSRVAWREKFWGRRYHAIVVSEEEAAQVARLRYLLSHGVKEGLVARVQEWPGLHSASALLGDGRMIGHWFDRSAEYERRRRTKPFERLDFASQEVVSLTALPCWKHLSREDYREQVLDLIEGIEQEAEALRRASGTRPLGVERILRQDPHALPAETKRGPAPLIHAISQAVRAAFLEAYRSFTEAFWAASAQLRAGHRLATFPPWSFAPAIGWIRTSEA